ncbi:MAG: MarR family transcriptional regulator [Actinomycetota bacterium]
MSERLVRGAIINELAVAARYANELAAAELRAAGVDLDEYGFLSFVGVLEPVTRTVLTKATGRRRTTVRDVVKRLLEQDHVRELPNPQDRRSTLLELTPRGRAIFDRGLPAIQRALAAIDVALGGKLDENEEIVWRVRTALQELVVERERLGVLPTAFESRAAP